MRRGALLLLLALTATACPNGSDYGGNGGTEVPTTLPPSESAVPTHMPTRSVPPATTEPTPSEKPVPVNRIIIAVRSNFEGFEYKQPDIGWKPATDGGPAVFVGDIIIFKNMDSEGFAHGWQNEAVDGYGVGELFDSGKLQPGEQYRYVVELEPGQYPYKDSSVPYRAAQGPMQVYER